MAIAKQGTSNTLTGQRRDYPPPPDGSSNEVKQWWQQTVEKMRQHDDELDALRDMVNQHTQQLAGN